MVNGPRKERINFWWVFGSWATGAVLVAAAFLTEHFYSWKGVALETLVSVGTALLLAGVLFFLQRRFVAEVEEVVTRAAESAAEAKVDERVQQVDARIDELGERINQALAARNQRQDAAVRALDVPSYLTVATALAEANKLGALANDRIRVQGSREAGELALDFSWGVEMEDGRFAQPQRTELKVSAYLYADERAVGGRPVIETIWGPEDSAEQVGLRLRAQLERRGRWRGEATLDWPMALRNLQKSLDVAIRSRRRDGSGWMVKGALFELVDEEWAITDAGLECPARAFILRESEFPDRVSARSQQESPAPWRPTAPDWVESGQWEELLAQGRRYFPIRRGPLASAPTWMALHNGPPATQSS